MKNHIAAFTPDFFIAELQAINRGLPTALNSRVKSRMKTFFSGHLCNRVEKTEFIKNPAWIRLIMIKRLIL